MISIKLIKRIIVGFVIIYFSLLIFSVVKSYVTMGDIIKASIIGVAVTSINILYEIFFKKDFQKQLLYVKKHLKKRLR